MKLDIRAVCAFVLSILIVAPIGVVPVQAFAGALGARGAAQPGGAQALALSYLGAGASAGNNLRPVSIAWDKPIEAFVGLSSRSLAAEQAHRQAMGLPALDGAAQKAYVASLLQAQAPLRAALEAAGVAVRYQYRVVYNGFAVFASPVALAQIASLPGVQRIQPTQVASLQLDNSVPFILGGKDYEELGSDGSGVTIAIIDTGIDYTHAAFGGSGDPDDYEANNATIIEPGSFPTTRVIGGKDFVGENYDARGATAPGGACSAIPKPDPDPLDVNGHGTHSASTAAGGAVMDGSTLLTPHGVAPGAWLFAFKIFSGCASDGTASTSTANVVAAIENATDPNGDGSTTDHADVISMSLGGPFGRDTEPSAVASNAAVDLGVIVVAAAGNAGDIPYIQDSPGAASGAISVAAGNDPGVFVQRVQVAGSSGGTADGFYESLEAAFTPPLATTGARSGPTAFVGDACAPFPAGSLTGMVPLIIRGTCLFVDKISNAQDAGAVAAVVYNNVAGAPIVMGGTKPGYVFTIPAVMVSNANGVKIQGGIVSGTTLTLDPTNALPIPDRLASFTSRGPRFGDSALKPDVTAPGVAILSAEVGTGTNSTPVSGTSFSTPHVAGAAAILRGIHPDWTVTEIKALLMNTATDARPDGSTPYPVALMGAGRIRVDKAAESESLVIPASVSFGVRESTAGDVRQYDQTLTLENKGPGAKAFDLSSVFLPTGLPVGAVVPVFPATVAVAAGGTSSFGFGLRVDFSKVKTGSVLSEVAGFLTLTQDPAGDVLRIPFHIIPIGRSDAHAVGGSVDLSESRILTLENHGMNATRVDLFQFGAESPDGDLIREAAGLPNEPDDWFDIRYVGVRTSGVFPVSSHPDQILEFAVSTWGLRSAPNNMVTDVYIDVDGGSPDYLVEVADLGLLTTGSFDGRMASAVFALHPRPGSPGGFLEFIVSNEKNTAWQTAPVVLGDLNALMNGGPKIGMANQPFRYFVVTTDLETGSTDTTGFAFFNAKNPALAASPSTISALAAGASATVTVVGNAAGGLLALYRNNVAGPAQSELITVTL